MNSANATRRNVMLMAWDFRRAEPSRPFADCLRGAWALSKKLAISVAKLLARAAGVQTLQLSPSLIRSPIQRATRLNRYGQRDDFRAAYTTARLGR